MEKVAFKSKGTYGGCFLFLIGGIAVGVAISLFLGPFWLFAGVLVGGGLGLKSQKSAQKGNGQLASEKLKERGFNTTNDIEGLVLLDAGSRKIAFVSDDHITIYDFEDIRTWNLEWKNQHMSGKKLEIKIIFELNDIENPIRKVSFSDYAEAEKCNLRLGQILKG